ncbi:hypothetical protein QLG13_28075 (plasmid) [Rhodococcus aetherivorans]|uniref:hypothetical protein n=1 Tax=Rhodococcus aetherivorans TaxID=191292 RepID=UPI0021A427B9|nr:hypothetical protein [Rhodococcus aetherivorans]
MAVLAYTFRDGIDPYWPVALAVVIAGVGALSLVTVPGDPLPLATTIALASIGPGTLAMVLAALPVPLTHQWQIWPLSAATAIYTFMCVRGRTLAAWIGFLLMIGVCIAWAAATGQGGLYGLSISVINFAPVLMSTFFALTIRPMARTIFELRERSLHNAAVEAAAETVMRERDAQLGRLDTLARPLLDRIATADELDEADLLECTLLEAQLRDSLRAPALTTDRVTAATRAARSRGVEVTLFDEQGLDEAPNEIRDRLLEAIITEIDATRTGSITVRVLPPGRSNLATVLASADTGTRRIEFDQNGYARPLSM